MAKYKMTPLARFFLFIVIVAPLLFLLATYLTGEKKYLNQVIEWVQPNEDAENAALIPDTTAIAKEDLIKELSSSPDTIQNMDTLSQKRDSASLIENKLSLRDSLNLLKNQLARCKNN